MTMESNKLIAEFMGGITSTVPNLINLPQNRGDANIHSVKGSEVLPNGTYSVHRLNELKYHESWDWLMPVINKIRSMDSTYEIEEVCKEEVGKYDWYNDISHYEFDLDLTYESVVEFINQYNKYI